MSPRLHAQGRGVTQENWGRTQAPPSIRMGGGTDFVVDAKKRPRLIKGARTLLKGIVKILIKNENAGRVNDRRYGVPCGYPELPENIRQPSRTGSFHVLQVQPVKQPFSASPMQGHSPGYALLSEPQGFAAC